MSLHSQEALLQQARALRRTEAFAEYQRRRQVSEHRIARLVQLGIRQARYFGRVKTLLQVLLTVNVANLTLVATRIGKMKRSYKTNSPCLVLRQRVAKGIFIIFVGLMRFLTQPDRLWRRAFA